MTNNFIIYTRTHSAYSIDLPYVSSTLLQQVNVGLVDQSRIWADNNPELSKLLAYIETVAAPLIDNGVVLQIEAIEYITPNVLGIVTNITSSPSGEELSLALDIPSTIITCNNRIDKLLSETDSDITINLLVLLQYMFNNPKNEFIHSVIHNNLDSNLDDILKDVLPGLTDLPGYYRVSIREELSTLITVIVKEAISSMSKLNSLTINSGSINKIRFHTNVDYYKNPTFLTVLIDYYTVV